MHINIFSGIFCQTALGQSTFPPNCDVAHCDFSKNDTWNCYGYELDPKRDGVRPFENPGSAAMAMMTDATVAPFRFLMLSNKFTSAAPFTVTVKYIGSASNGTLKVCITGEKNCQIIAENYSKHGAPAEVWTSQPFPATTEGDIQVCILHHDLFSKAFSIYFLFSWNSGLMICPRTAVAFTITMEFKK